jgi:hypothetical protein
MMIRKDVTSLHDVYLNNVDLVNGKVKGKKVCLSMLPELLISTYQKHLLVSSLIDGRPHKEWFDTSTGKNQLEIGPQH